MTFSRFVLLAASIAASVAFAPALAQEHEIGHWWPTPGGSSHYPAGREATAAVHGAAWPSFSGGVSVAAGDVSGDGQKQFNGFVSRFPAGTLNSEVHATPLEDPRLQVPDARQEGKYYDVTLKRGTAATPGSGDMTLKGQNILVPPMNPASTPMLKLDGIDAKPAIAINTPLRTLPNRSPVADGSSNTLMMGEKSPRPAPAVAGPARR